MPEFKPKLLFISYNFPPTKVPSGVRLANLFRQFSRHFESIAVFSTANRRFFLTDPGLKIDAQVFELPTWDLRRLTLLERGDRPVHLSNASHFFSFRRFMARLTDSFPFNLIWGDGGLIYCWFGYRRGAEVVKKQGITHLFSSFRPYSDHFIAFLLKRRFPHLYWIADFRDLHLDSPLHEPFFPVWQRWCTSKILARADAVTTVSEGLAGRLEPWNPHVHVLRTGIPSLVFPPPAPRPDKFRITYTGSLYPRCQTIQPLLKGLRNLLSKGKLSPYGAELVYAGKDGDIWRQWCRQAGLEHLVVDHGLIPLVEARRLQGESQINLLLSWSNERQKGILTSKFYEYLAAGRPVLAIVHGSPDEEFIRIFRELNAGMLHFTDNRTYPDLQGFLSDSIDQWSALGMVPSGLATEKMEKYRWD